MSSPRNLGMVNPRKELEFQQKPQDSSSAWAGIKLFFPVGRSPEFWKKGREKESGILGERKTEPLKLPELFGNLIPAGFGRSLKIPLKIPSFQLVFLLPEQLTGNFFHPNPSIFSLWKSFQALRFFSPFPKNWIFPDLFHGNPGPKTPPAKLQRTWISLEFLGIEDWEFLFRIGIFPWD